MYVSQSYNANYGYCHLNRMNLTEIEVNHEHPHPPAMQGAAGQRYPPTSDVDGSQQEEHFVGEQPPLEGPIEDSVYATEKLVKSTHLEAFMVYLIHNCI